jgi:prevent-host-death family protein
MKTLNASDAKREFGEVLINAQHGPVGINRNGKPVAVIISAAEYDRLAVIKVAHLKQEIEKGLADLRVGNVKDGKTVIDKLRKRINV